MSVHAGKAKLTRGLKDLKARWDVARTKWDDAASRDFEKKHLEHLEPRTRIVLSAMDHMSEILARIRRDCGS